MLIMMEVGHYCRIYLLCVAIVKYSSIIGLRTKMSDWNKFNNFSILWMKLCYIMLDNPLQMSCSRDWRWNFYKCM